MNKEQSADDPSVDLIRLNSAFHFYELPDVVIACNKLSGVSGSIQEQIEAALVKHR